MTKDEAIAFDLALNALLWANNEINDWRHDARGYKPEDQPQIMEAITAIKQALAAPVQEPWEQNDTAYRPGGLPQDFIKHEVKNEGDWSEWVNPNSEQYFMKCCDCGLVHEMQFNVAKYSEGDECEFVADADLQAVFRARRATPPAAPVQEPVAYIEHHKGGDNLVWGDPGGKRSPLYTTPPAAQRQWVGLTDEEFRHANKSTMNLPIEEVLPTFTRAIEAKLKEKNT